MLPEPAPTPEAWHADLARTDKAVHVEGDAHALQAENAALEQRLAGLLAELRIARSAVAVRDAILRELTVVARERDHELTEAVAAAAAAAAEVKTIQATKSWRLSQRAARALRAPGHLVHR